MVLTSPYMAEAMAAAKSARDAGEVPVGAVLVQGGRIVARAHNLVRSRPDPTAHAEILVLREAALMLGSERLEDCDLYVTLEPCAMCAQAIAFARVRRLYYAAGDEKGGGVDHGARIFAQSTCHHRPEVISGLMESESAALLKDFFASLR